MFLKACLCLTAQKLLNAIFKIVGVNTLEPLHLHTVTRHEKLGAKVPADVVGVPALLLEPGPDRRLAVPVKVDLVHHEQTMVDAELLHERSNVIVLLELLTEVLRRKAHHREASISVLMLKRDQLFVVSLRCASAAGDVRDERDAAAQRREVERAPIEAIGALVEEGCRGSGGHGRCGGSEGAG